MDPLAELELRDAQINQALKKANQKLQRPESLAGKGDEESIDQLLDLVKSIDVDAEIRKNKINIDDRTDFAERLEEIESKVDTETYDPLENERELQIDGRVPAEGRERFLRARCRVLQEEVNRLQKQLQTSQEKAAKSRKDQQEKTETLSRLEKSHEKQRKEFDKLKSQLSTESSKRELAEKEAQKLKRDVEELKRAEKVKKPGSKQNDIRLQRALDEVQKYKSEMAELVRKNRDQGTVTRHQFDEASKETQKQKRLNSEYKSVIQKQSKLIEILRNKCTHLEAARVLEFTEEEFLRALDWQK